MKIKCPNCHEKIDWQPPRRESYIGEYASSSEVQPSRESSNSISCPNCNTEIKMNE